VTRGFGHTATSLAARLTAATNTDRGSARLRVVRGTPPPPGWNHTQFIQ
jgi:hypothetical protein